MKKNLLIGIIGLIIIGIGSGILPIEITNIDYQDTIHPNILMETYEKEYLFNDNIKNKVYFSIDDPKVVIDNTLTNSYVIRVTYPKNYFKMQSVEIPDVSTFQIFYDFDSNFNSEQLKGLFNIFLQDLANKKFYNYADTFMPKVEVRVSSNNLQYLEVFDDNAYDNEGYDF